ncbi:alpha/beta hydrolase [Streptomyces sp. CB01635]|uniref:alpha/beta fold hydrolase n=1 Tax=unclassified Streptomyces TaxID=2593676 RepID=UPI000C273E81|nr:alpha/beta fold hydrolase [Streptomyces sp. CB01635]PJN11685.1 alpha/beta hydrolase [Streptomyces sp. CB01635]
MSRLTSNGVTIHFDDLGPADGVPVVLIHGHPFNRTMWRPQTAALTAAGYRLIAPDLRGYGDSDTVAGTVLFPAFADDIAALLDHLELDRAVVGGVSMGGQITMEFQRSHPQRVRALVLADTSPVAETDEGRVFRNRLADRLLAEGMHDYAGEVIDKMLAAYNVTAMPQVAAHVLEMMRTTEPAGAAAALRGRAERVDYRETLAATSAPTLIVVGADDVYTPPEDARAIQRLTPHATLTVVERAGHLPNMEQPDAVNTALIRFLNSLPD